MILRELLFVVAAFVLEFSLSANVQPRERHGMTLSECAARGGECDETKTRQVCGTDNQTYPSRCHLIRAQCSGHEVSLKHHGPCKTCKAARDYALKRRIASSVYVPRCKSDGTYAPVQCIKHSRCWCSDPSGRPISNSTAGNANSRCHRFNKSNTRRSPIRQNKNRRACNKVDRMEFINKLIKHFENEYNRTGINIKPSEKVVLSWKFGTLDLNHNQDLDKNEFRELKKLVKRAVKPARCARTFGKICDINADGKLTLNEWNTCLSKEDKLRNQNNGGNNILPDNLNNIENINSHNENNGNNNKSNNKLSFNTNHLNVHNKNHQNVHTSNYINTKMNSNNNNQNINQNIYNNNNDNNEKTENSSNANKITAAQVVENDESSQNVDYDEGDYEDEVDEEDISITKPFGSSTNFPSIYYLQAKPEQPKEETEIDCLKDRENFLENQNNGGSAFYLPACTDDGRYQKIQCFKSAQYCWCVNEENGHPIPGTSVKNKRPQCDSLPVQPKIMKGCPEPKKSKFIMDLKDFLKLKFTLNSTDTNLDDDSALKLCFNEIDRDSTKVWERKEWKFFRDMVSRSRNLKKCGKRFPRYCDANSDKIVSLSEWLTCLQIQRTDSAASQNTLNSSESVTKSSKLLGLNPLEQYLKE